MIPTTTGDMYESIELGDFDTVFWRRHSEVAAIDIMDSGYTSADHHRSFKRGQGTLGYFPRQMGRRAGVYLFLNVINGLNGAEVRVCPVSSHNSERTVLLW